MKIFRNPIYLTLVLGVMAFMANFYVCEAAEYKGIYPGEVSAVPAIVQDERYRDAIVTQETDMKRQKQVAEAEQTRLITGKEKVTLVGSEPTKIYYQVSVNDRLFVSVWRVPDLSLEFIVGPDGKISFPLIGDIQAAGKTLAGLRAEITEKLKEYVENPQVSVMVRQFAGDKLTVIGEVRVPGIYKFVGKTNILDVIALAGGLTDRAQLGNLVIVRQPKDPAQDVHLISVDIKSILKGDLSKNIAVEPNDIIYVSRTFLSNVKEFYDNWFSPILRSAMDYETYKSLKLSNKNQ